MKENLFERLSKLNDTNKFSNLKNGKDGYNLGLDDNHTRDINKVSNGKFGPLRKSVSILEIAKKLEEQMLNINKNSDDLDIIAKDEFVSMMMDKPIQNKKKTPKINKFKLNK